MSNTFNLSRFISYFKKHSLDNGKTYLLSTAVLIGILVLSLFFTVAMGGGYLSTDWQMTVLMFCVLLGGSIFTSLTFADMGDKKKAIPALTLPVSHLEKYLVSWLFTYPIFLIVAIGSFYLVDIMAVSFSQPSTYLGPSKLLDLTTKQTPWSIVIGLFTILHAFTFWGAITFNKMHFIKTAFVFFICFFAVNLMNKGLLFLISENHVGHTVLFSGAEIVENGNHYRFEPNNPVLKFMPFICGMEVLILWASAFFKLKEKQV